MEDKFFLSSSPHIRHSDTTSKIMLEVMAALIPAVIAGAIFFGVKTLFMVLFSMAVAVIAEALYEYLAKKPLTVFDGSAMLTGMLLALCSPPTLPFWMLAIGDLFAIIVVKQFFGGLGHNFMNPAMTGRAFLLAAWPAAMTTWAVPFNVDTISSATALSGADVTLLNAFLGNMEGCIGEVSALALLIGGIYLIARGIIKPYIPLTYIVTVFVFTTLAGRDGLMQILSGGLLLASFFMATDYVTCPVTVRGQIIMGIGCGVITSVIRLWGGYPEGVTYGVLLMNAATPIIDKFTVPKKYGEVRNV